MSSRMDLSTWNTEGNRLLWIIVAVGFLARVIVLAVLPDQAQQTDILTYLTAANDIWAGRLFTSELVMPLYPLQAALMGGQALALKVSDVVLSTLSIWLIHGIALKMFKDNAAALVAALAAAFYPFFLFYAVSGLTETSYTFFVLLGFYLLYQGRLVWGAGVLVLSILSRPSLEPLLPILLLAFALIVHRLTWRQAGLLLAKTVLIYVVLMTPWWAHNYAKYDQFVHLNLGAGRMLYMGNNPLNQSGGGLERIDADMSRFYREIDDPLIRNTAMKDEAIAYIRDNPGHFVAMAGVKFLRFWRLWPHAAEYQNWKYIVISLASYGLALALAGAFLLRHALAHWRVLTPVVLFAGFLSAVHMATLGSIRYRFPLEPFILILAAQMAVEILTRWGTANTFLARLRGTREVTPEVLK